MNVKNVVKVMNFHSLLRVDKARREAEKYFMVENELRLMIDTVTNNQNFVLDKQAMLVNKKAPVLNIYVGSDLGFCSSYNSNVNEAAREDSNTFKIIIGKKIRKGYSNIVLSMTKEEYLESHKSLTDYLTDSIKEQKYSQINILYNHYVNTSQIEWRSKRVYPLKASEDAKKRKYDEDYVCESDVTTVLLDMVITYVDVEIQLTVKNSLASENIMRQNSTSESLKKIDELEDEKKKIQRKEKTLKASERITETYTKNKYLQDHA